MRFYGPLTAALLACLTFTPASAEDSAAEQAQIVEVAKGICAALAAPLFCNELKTNEAEVHDFFTMGGWTANDFSPPKGKFAKICEAQMAYLSSEVKKNKPAACASVFQTLNTADVKLLVKK